VVVRQKQAKTLKRHVAYKVSHHKTNQRVKLASCCDHKNRIPDTV